MKWQDLFRKTVHKTPVAFRLELGDSPAGALYDYWDRKRGARPFPADRSVDPVDMPKVLLPSLYLLQAEPNGQYRFRLAGTRLRDVFGLDPTGKTLEQVLPALDLANANRSYGRVLDTARPWYSRVVYETHDRGSYIYQRLTLPTGAERRPNRLLGGLFLYSETSFVEDFGILHDNNVLRVASRFEMVAT